MSLGRAGIKPTEALLTASRRARPGGGGTKLLPKAPPGRPRILFRLLRKYDITPGYLADRLT